MKLQKTIRLGAVACTLLALCAGCAQSAGSDDSNSGDANSPPPSVPVANGASAPHGDNSNPAPAPAPAHTSQPADPTPPPAGAPGHGDSGDVGSFSYSFSENGCSTGKHRFDTRIEECYGLADTDLNHDCAEAMRRKLFHKLGCDGGGSSDQSDQGGSSSWWSSSSSSSESESEWQSG
jgi:hypothetical protein